MEKIWKSTPPRKITEVGENLFIFQFQNEEDRQIIINAGPWNFDDRMVLPKPLEMDDRPRKELLTKAYIWTQVYGLPFVAMTEKMGQLIGAKFGNVIEVKTDEEGKGLGMCLAIRIEIDVRKQLKRRMKIAIEEEQEVFVDFKYERLSALCYCCGIIGHNDADCGIAIRRRKEGNTNPIQYGNWLRAPSRQKMIKNKGASGKKGEQPNQNMESGSYGGGGNGRGLETETTVGERGSMVIFTASRGAGGNVINWSNPLGKSDRACGKEKEVVEEIVKNQIREEGKEQSTDEMTGQRIGERAAISKAGKEVIDRKEETDEEGQNPYTEANLGLIMSRTLSGENISKVPNNETPFKNEKGNDQNKWRRLAKGEDMVIGNEEQNQSIKLGKRGGKERDKGEEADEEQGKRWKGLGETVANIMAEAAEQPRPVQ